MKKIHIVAGGKGERIADYCDVVGVKVKHLLPVANTNLLLNNCQQALSSFKHIVVSASSQNVGYFENFFYTEKRFHKQVSLSIDYQLTGPLGPIAREMFRSKSKTLFLATGDAYADFEWESLIKFHQKVKTPVTLLAAASVSVPNGAVFTVRNDGLITDWERKLITNETDLINIGYYCINNDKEVKQIFKKMTQHKEDDFFKELISKELVSAYVIPNAFNVNTLEAYRALQEYILMKK